MTLRRPHRPGPKQPALQQPILLDRGAGSMQSIAASAAADVKAGMDDFLRQLDAALQEDPSLDRDARDALMQQFEDAMSVDGNNGGGASLAALADRSLWMDAVQSLQSSGAMGENEANDLIRQINQALQPLQRRESQLAIEFSRRLQTEGEEKALAWFRREAAALSNGGGAERTSVPTPSADVSPLRSEVVNSRSRRLRGPPPGR